MITMTCLFSCLCFLAALALASPHGCPDLRPSLIHRSGVKRYVDTFRGGAIIDIPQLSHDKPAVLSVAATWNIPFIKPNPGADLHDVNNRHEMGQWVGITGGHCDDAAGGALLQAGTDTALLENGKTEAFAWLEWLPAAAFALPPENMTVHPGDNIRVTIRIDTADEGFVEIQNLNTGQKWSDAVANPHPEAAGSAMCLGNGTAWFLNEWVLGVPGTKPDRERTVLPVFSNISFADVQARDRLGHHFNLGNPTADYWNTTQAGTETPVFISEPVGAEEFVVYSPEGKGWVPSAE
ncbi:hypothetical protein DL769_006518 [Monosporascus sp. CRB-8-3]|nr:hypothetical protein DL769_006518 [Monosporascus sp. CRB-8-3]